LNHGELEEKPEKKDRTKSTKNTKKIQSKARDSENCGRFWHLAASDVGARRTNNPIRSGFASWSSCSSWFNLSLRLCDQHGDGMSAQPTAPAAPPDMVNIEIDGKPMQVPKNSMIIAAADKAGIAIPRFCYHDKLPIAANCRMCMVETEMGGKPVPKPQPACATPVMEGMKIFTQSQRALSAQRNVMEFLLINHPLDCPICDQGGECELQDLSMGYGRSVSRFAERKRVVPDEDLGPLIATEMTRCIQCTRCVRFMTEVAGSPELGGLGRGENLEIGTYIGKSIDSELGGNIIDVCPVGALTNKVFRFKARPWELIARESIGYHDALGSNLWLHTRRGEVLRTVPRDNEAINECWLSDRDRYSHEGMYAGDRATKPMIRKDGELVEASWEEAIAFVADGLRKHAGAELGALVAPLASCEEGWLLAKVVRGLCSDSIDHRLRTLDFTDGAAGATFALPLAQIEKARTILLVGSNPRHEQPLLGHRIRQAWKHGAKVFAINPLDFDFNFGLAGKTIATPAGMIEALLKLAKVANDDGRLPDSDGVAGAIAGLAAECIAQPARGTQAGQFGRDFWRRGRAAPAGVAAASRRPIRRGGNRRRVQRSSGWRECRGAGTRRRHAARWRARCRGAACSTAARAAYLACRIPGHEFLGCLRCGAKQRRFSRLHRRLRLQRREAHGTCRTSSRVAARNRRDVHEHRRHGPNDCGGHEAARRRAFRMARVARARCAAGTERIHLH